MKLTKLTLEQFRNYPDLQLSFEPDNPVTYIVGHNAQGKTNILEAIYLLALTKSFRTAVQPDLIQWGCEYARVKGEFELEEEKTGSSSSAITGESSRDGHSLPAVAGTPSRRGRSCVLEVFIGNPPHPKKSHKKNGVKTGTENFIGTCKIVFFHPEDLNMLYLGPDLRRRYLDVLNLQISKKYYRALRTYRQVIKQRNALLREIKGGFASRSDLEVWNEQIIEHGSFIVMERAKTVKFINEHLQEYYQKIAKSKDKITVFYRHAIGSVKLEDFDITDQEAIKTCYASALRKAEITDLQAEVTTVGPHRDDLEFALNDRKLGSHASRGEYRSLLLALKLLELKFFEEQGGEKPLLLLDDVFSELDFERQKMLLQRAKEGGHQTIITATHLDEVVAETRQHGGLKHGQHLQIKDGAVKKA